MSATTLSLSKRQRVRPPLCAARGLPRLLVVDDDEDLRLLYADVLTPLGYHVAGAVDRAAAWHALRGEPFDLLITSNQPPTLTGAKLLQQLRGARMHLPVILISNLAPAGELNRHRRLDVSATLFKPHTSEELVETVREVLQLPASGFNAFASRSAQRTRTAANHRAQALRNRRWDLI